MQGFDLASISIIVASASVFVGVVLAVLQLRDQVRTRQAQLFMQLYDHFSTKEFQRYWMEIVYLDEYEDFEESQDKPTFLLGETDIEVASMVGQVCAFFEGMGLLVKRRLIDINLVAELLSSPVFWVWERLEKHVRRTRELQERPQIWEWFEYLYYEIQRIPSRKSRPVTPASSTS
jgi:hypothetical protein